MSLPCKVPSNSRILNLRRNCREELWDRIGPGKHQPSQTVSLKAQALGRPDLQWLGAAGRPAAIPQEVALPAPAPGTGAEGKEDPWESYGQGVLRNWKMNSGASRLGGIR